MMTLNKRGFTLIELLVVIGIIGILAGIVISVINPAQQRVKANQAVMRASVEKACLAAVACVQSSSTGVCTATAATVANNVGITLTNGQPAGSAYTYTFAGGGVATIVGTIGACIVTCTPTAVGTNPIALSGTCLIN